DGAGPPGDADLRDALVDAPVSAVRKDEEREAPEAAAPPGQQRAEAISPREDLAERARDEQRGHLLLRGERVDDVDHVARRAAGLLHVVAAARRGEDAAAVRVRAVEL